MARRRIADAFAPKRCRESKHAPVWCEEAPTCSGAAQARLAWASAIILYRAST